MICALAASVVGWQREPASTEAASPVIDGADLVHSKGCSSCHQVAGSQPIGGAPSLVDARSWAASRRPGMSAEEYVAESIRAPSTFVSPAWDDSRDFGMPDLGLTDDEIDALVTFLLRG
jgi:mono/diheme cytochrome c family protein